MGYRTEDELTTAKTKLNRVKFTECLGFAYWIRSTKGYPYMLTSIIYLADGSGNGAIGTSHICKMEQ
jgi:hypothetical protein